MKINLYYFARLRDQFGRDSEIIELPVNIKSISCLIAYLSERGGVWADELEGSRVYRVALNQELASLDSVLSDNAEVAIFPPVTGG